MVEHDKTLARPIWFLAVCICGLIFTQLAFWGWLAFRLQKPVIVEVQVDSALDAVEARLQEYTDELGQLKITTMEDVSTALP